MRVYIRRESPFRVFLLQVRADKLLTSELRLLVGEIPKPIQNAIESALRDGNDEGELQGWGRWEEWDEFENDMRLKELAESIQTASAKSLTDINRHELTEMLFLIREGLE